MHTAGRLLAYALLGFFLFGCAAQNAYREGRSLLAQGKNREGLARIEEATRLDPRSVEYRAAYLQARERLLNTWITQADRARNERRYDDAEQAYLQAQQIASD
ncbi:MAG TPA: hypothetical protein VFS42_11095, partial [Burkholderiaceae bacterium]|nr:hypothetical protein [Burkholderiaceae bacterium]